MPGLRERVLDLLYFLGRYSGCHRMPERSFYFRGYIFPVCARCTGIFLAMPFAVYFGFFWQVPWLVAVLLVPMGLDWGLNYLKITKGSNYRRFVTGFLGGFAVYVLQIKLLLRLIDVFRQYILIYG